MNNNNNNNNNELKNEKDITYDKDLPVNSSGFNLSSKDNLGNIGNDMSCNTQNGIGIRTLNLKLMENEKLDRFGAVALNNNNNNNNNNRQSNRNKNKNNKKQI